MAPAPPRPVSRDTDDFALTGADDRGKRRKRCVTKIEVARLVKPEWGTKRLCLECGAKFYDMLRDPITCPACETVLKPEPPPKSRRASAAKAKPAPVKVEKPPPEAAPEEATEEVTTATGNSDDPAAEIADVAVDNTSGQQDIIEDATELGEDEDDMAEVLDTGSDKKEAQP